MTTVHVFGPASSLPTSGFVVNVTAAGKDDFRFLSPHVLEPTGGQAKTLENLWQYTKLFKEYTDNAGNPTSAYFTWREAGFALAGSVHKEQTSRPVGHWWQGEKLDEVSARRKIYAPQYTAAALAHCSGQIQKLKQMGEIYKDIWIYDEYGYDHLAYDMSLSDVLNNIEKPFSHAFIVASLVTGERLY